MADSSPKLDRALTLMAAATGQAAALGIGIAVVVVDVAGNAVAMQTMDSAYLTAPELARRKAFTACNFRTPTHAMAERVQPIEYQLQVTLADPRLSFIKGGLPLPEGGGIGVSGGSGDQDLACCEAALANAN